MSSISFLFGCGISIPARLPGTWDISNEILCKWDDWYKCGNEYRLKASSGQSNQCFDNSPYKDYTKKIACFLNLINKEILQYYGYVAKVDVVQNYEEIYDFVYHIKKALTRDIDNPLTNRIIQSLVHSIELLRPQNQDLYQELKLLCEESMLYIKSILISKLSKIDANIDYLKIIGEIYSLGNLKGIITLNHDVLTETYLEQNNIEFVDGFQSSPEKGIKIWNSFIESDSDKLKFLKLHGSLNWYQLTELDEAVFHSKSTMSSINCEIEDSREIFIDAIHYKISSNPEYLTGTNDKYLEYHYGVYTELFNQFHRLLSDTDVLIVAGYGFGDNAVNLRIIDWMNNPKNKIEIVTPNVDATIKNARGAIYSKLQDWDINRVNFIEKGIQAVKIDDFKFINQ